MKLIRYSLKYLRQNPYRTLLRAAILFVMSFVLFAAWDLRKAESDLEKELSLSVPITYNLNGSAAYMQDEGTFFTGVGHSPLTSRFYFNAMTKTIEGIEEVMNYEEVSSAEIIITLQEAVRTNEGSKEALILVLDDDTLSKIGPYITEGNNIKNSNDLIVSNELLLEEHIFRESFDDIVIPKHIPPKLNDEMEMQYEVSYDNEHDFTRYSILGEHVFKVSGFFDPSSLNTILNSDKYSYADVIMSVSGLKDYYLEYKEKCDNFEKEPKDFSGLMVFISTFYVEGPSFTTKKASFHFDNLDDALTFKEKAEDYLNSNIASLDHAERYADLVFNADSGENDIDHILEPFTALRRNLDSSIIFIVILCVLLYLIFSYNILKGRQKELMIRRSMGEGRFRQFKQYLFENILIALIVLVIGFVLDALVISALVQKMFERSIAIQNDLKRVATGELLYFEDVEKKVGSVLDNIDLSAFVYIGALVIGLVIIVSIISFITVKKKKIIDLLRE